MKIAGLKELEAQLEQLGAVAGQKALARAARAAFKPVLAAARAKVPVDTGLLRDSLRLAVSKPGTGEVVAAAGLTIVPAKGTKVSKRVRRNMTKKARKFLARQSAHWRWHFIEKGTKKMKAKPFLRPAFDENKDQVLGALKAEIQKAIAAAIKKKNKGG